MKLINLVSYRYHPYKINEIESIFRDIESVCDDKTVKNIRINIDKIQELRSNPIKVDEIKVAYWFTINT